MKRIAGWMFGAVGLGGVAMGAELSAPPSPHSQISQAAPPGVVLDSNESVNRGIFDFNSWLVRDLVNPAADWLDQTLPEVVKQGARNLYGNLTEPEFILTNSLVGDYDAAWVSTKRFLINSTLGIAGIFDTAGWMGYQRTETEFTDSLCAAGFDPGNFVVLPMIGPASSHSALLLTGFFAVEWYLLAHISPVVATADLVIDVSASAASLRFARDVPDGQSSDPYAIQREDYQGYLAGGYCARYLDQQIPGSVQVVMDRSQGPFR
jgi:phospholipid-binding lipoprotein MlaA